MGFALLDIPDQLLTKSNLPAEHFKVIEPADLIRPLKALKAEGAEAYLYRQEGHFHWTPRGHEIGAELLANKVDQLLTKTHRHDGTKM